MDETSGSSMGDASGHGNVGTLKHIALGVPGFNGSRGYGFDGKSSVILVPNKASLNAGTADLVVKVHVAFSKVPADDYDLIRKGLAEPHDGIQVVVCRDQRVGCRSARHTRTGGRAQRCES
jgi:hypothetical protein